MGSVVDIIQHLFMVFVVGFCYGFRRRRKHCFYGFRRWFVHGFRRRRKHFFYGFRRWFVHGFRRGRKTIVYGFRRWILMDSAVAGGSEISECIERFLVLGWFLGLVSVAVLFTVSVVAGKHLLWFPSLVFYGFRRGKERCLFVSVVCFVYGFPLLQDRGSLSDGNHKQQNNIRTFP